MHRWSIALSALLASGCAREREPAPAELEEIAAFMFLHWEDEETMKGAMEALAVMLEAQVDTDVAERGWVLTPLGEESIQTVEPRPAEPDLSALLGAAVAARSPHSLTEHAESLTLTDQVWSNPTNYRAYTRVITEGDPERFTSGADRILRTVNEVETANFGVQIPYTLHKDYQWLEPGLFGPRFEPAIIGRAWIDEPSCNAGGGNCVNQSWSIDLFSQSASGIIRFTSTWSEVDGSIPLGDDLLVRGLAVGMYQVFESSDEFIAEGGLEVQ
jgi:hypothetical protein